MKEKVVIYNPDFIDLILLYALKDVEKGTYVDVGANDPLYESVTKIFYDRGWSGINIEPQKEYHDLLQTDRPRDVNLCVGAGDREDEMVLYGNLQWATMERTIGDEKIQTIVKVMPLSKIMDENLCQGAEVHFCKIDVEGFEKQVLEGIDLNRHRPWIFAIESVDPRKRKNTFEKWEHILIDNDYVLALGDTYNRYYVDNKRSDLKDKFVCKEKLVEMYDVYLVSRARLAPPYRFLTDFIYNVLQKVRNP